MRNPHPHKLLVMSDIHNRSSWILCDTVHVSMLLVDQDYITSTCVELLMIKSRNTQSCGRD